MRIHFISNSLRMNSGFSNVTRYIATGLKKLGHDVSMTGLQTAYLPEYSYGIECLPIDTVFVDETTQAMLNIQKTNPEIVFCIHQADADMNHLFKLFPREIAYIPVEGMNIHEGMANDLKSIEKNGGVVVAQCKYGQSEMKKVGVNAKCIYHGFNDKIFLPLKDKDTRYCYYATDVGKVSTDPLILHRQGCYDCQVDFSNIYNSNVSKGIKKDCPYFKEEIIAILRYDDNSKRWIQKDIEISKLKDEFKGKYIYLFIGQNFGLRKRIERLLKAYSILISESRQIKDGSILHLHTMPISVKGINLIKVIQDLGINKNVTFSYGSFRSSSWSEESLCLVPESPILTLNKGIQKIKDIKIGDKVLTHKGRFMRVSNVMNRQYHGDMIKIFPYGLRVPLILTPEHRVLAIKTVLCEGFVNIANTRICRPGLQCYHRNNVGNTKKICKYTDGYEPYRKYRIQWIRAKYLEIGDFVIYPKSNEEIDINDLKILDYMIDDIDELGIRDYSNQTNLFGEYINELTTRNQNSDMNIRIPSKIKLTEDIMRIFGYFIAEGHIYEDELGFTFNINEREYIENVENIMKDTFGLSCGHNIKNKNNGITLRYQNKILAQMFKNMFAPNHDNRKGSGRKSHVVQLPQEFLNLPKNKLSELIKGYWRGDGSNAEYVSGCIRNYSMGTTSETLAYHILYILSKFDILPSIIVGKEDPERNRHKNFQIIIGGKDIVLFNKIIDEDHNLKKDELIRVSQYVKGKNNFFIPIKDIENICYKGTVWNLDVEEDDSYVSTIAIHNCILYNLSDVNVSASSSEGYGLPTLESMACGIPNIGPDCSSFTELIGKNDNKPRGLLARIGEWQMIQDQSIRALVDERDLSNQMKIMYTKKEDRKIYSKNAQEWAKNHTWDNKVKEWNDLFKKMIS